MTGARLEVRDPAPDATVLDTMGSPVALSSFWRGGFAALVFLRHYG